METAERINVRGRINNLEVKGEPLVLPKGIYKPSNVRTTASSLTSDTGKTFTVSVTDDLITVIRNS